MRILDKKDRGVIADEIENSLFGINLVAKPRISAWYRLNRRRPVLSKSEQRPG